MVTIPTTFKAYEFANYGDVLEEAKLNANVSQKPLEPTQVRVKVVSAAINPLDYKLLLFGSAFLPTAPTAETPLRMGFDTAGVVVEVGSGDVRGFKVGDAVYGTPDITAGGSFAEYFAIDTKYLAHKPSNLTFNEAAGVPMAGQTSFQALNNLGKLEAGQRVLILGGSSATGQFAVQVAKARGANVITTVSPRNIELVTSLGADQVIDYTSKKWGTVLAEHSVDLIYDCGVEPASWATDAQKVLKKNSGKFVTIGMGPKPVESPIGATFHQLFLHPNQEDIQSLTKLVEAGQVKPTIDSVHPFEKLLDAIKLQMSNRAQGKIIIEISNE
ncbi:hypothetical protein JG687_00010979 [Phytophthora cactorum]|uniref:Enoyl reductase (ER) domain-containing protein n=1 Tax=Phytophthora cactorum TaxID=29920 RepID=A0A329RM83_9STRA|nr:Polyketide synthase, enoylreductase domain [Phytophthora cactorum]KAG2780741.1 hypothetical protein Pcac1_g9530 [Phytophthora cactorum]KAG2805558.1 hypothetical protein PC112_g18222 [Phytophthora cactorum]KAG2839680.1 hypothetical protein PC111_g3787 [Phytophthora cactorum]KAG2864155.1 hypothetical protein PC113_g4856 [Phytophthora cactorum]